MLASQEKYKKSFPAGGLEPEPSAEEAQKKCHPNGRYHWSNERNRRVRGTKTSTRWRNDARLGGVAYQRNTDEATPPFCGSIAAC